MPAYKGGGPIQSIAGLVAQPLPGLQYKIICGIHDFDGTRLGVQCNKWLTWNARTDVFYCDETAGHNAVKELQLGLKRHPDHVLYLNGLYSFKFVILPLLFSGAKKIIISARGMLHPGALGQKPLKKKIYLAAWRWLGLHKKVVFHASTEEEARFVKDSFGPHCTVVVAANFSKSFALQQMDKKRVGELSMVSVSLISPMKNHLLILQALMLVNHNIRYTIYGPVKDAGYWQQCDAQIKLLPANVTVDYRGEIPPPQIETALQNGQVFILPSQSENFGHALYEALTAGKPVITSHYTPWNELLENKAGYNTDLTPQAIADAIDFFATMEFEELQKWAVGARALALKSRNDNLLKDAYGTMFNAGNPLELINRKMREMPA